MTKSNRISSKEICSVCGDEFRPTLDDHATVRTVKINRDNYALEIDDIEFCPKCKKLVEEFLEKIKKS